MLICSSMYTFLEQIVSTYILILSKSYRSQIYHFLNDMSKTLISSVNNLHGILHQCSKLRKFNCFEAKKLNHTDEETNLFITISMQSVNIINSLF